MTIHITNVKDAIELMDLCGYPVRQVKWVTWGGGALQDFDNDEELIEFAEAMRKRIDKNIEGMFGSEDRFTEAMQNAGLLEKEPPTTGISKTVNQHGEEKVMGISVKRIMSKHRYPQSEEKE